MEREEAERKLRHLIEKEIEKIREAIYLAGYRKGFSEGRNDIGYCSDSDDRGCVCK